MKKIACIGCFLVVLLLCGMPFAYAAPPVSGDLIVDGIFVVSGGAVITPAGTGWSYNDNTLELSSYNGGIIFANDMGDFTIQLTAGTSNEIDNPLPAPANFGIAAYNGTNLTVAGAAGASLALPNTSGNLLGGFFIDNTSTLVFDNAVVSANSNTFTIGFYGPTLTIQNGSVITVNSVLPPVAATSVGIYVFGGELIIDNSTVIAAGGYDAISMVNSPLTVTDSSVTATGTENAGILIFGADMSVDNSTIHASGNNAGIAVGGAATVTNGSNITAVADNVIGFGAGSIQINDSTVTASSDTGMAASNGSITIVGSTVTATGSSTAGIEAFVGDISITNATVDAVGNTTGITAEGGAVTISSGSLVNATGTTAYGIFARDDMLLSGSAVTAHGRLPGLYSSIGEMEITSGRITAQSDEDVSIRANSGSIITSGGTTVAKEGLFALSTIVITGGSVDAPAALVSPQPVNAGGIPVYRTDIRLQGAAVNSLVTALVGVPGYYGVVDIYTDNAMSIYPWLPLGSTVTEAETEDGMEYYGNVDAGMSGTLGPFVPPPKPTPPPKTGDAAWPVGRYCALSLCALGLFIFARRRTRADKTSRQ